MERIHYIHEEFDAPALIEEYIEGREIYAAVLGNESPEVLPMVELDLSRLPEGTPKIAGKEVKWEKDTEHYRLTKSAPAEDLDEETTKRLSDTALSAPGPEAAHYRTTCARPGGEVYVIEANQPGSPARVQIRPQVGTPPPADGEIVDLARARYAAA
jgi:D-alanine-D-alanine ligase